MAAQNQELAVDRNMHPQMIGMHNLIKLKHRTNSQRALYGTANITAFWMGTYTLFLAPDQYILATIIVI